MMTTARLPLAALPRGALLSLLAPLLLAFVVSGCVTITTTPPGTVLPPEKTAQVQAGQTTRAELLARLGPTRMVRFDNGVEVWRYLLPAAPTKDGAGYGEYVVVLDARGVVTRTRLAPVVYQLPAKN